MSTGLLNSLFDEAEPDIAAATLQKGRFLYERCALPDWLF
jgi:hypothetical protein